MNVNDPLDRLVNPDNLVDKVKQNEILSQEGATQTVEKLSELAQDLGDQFAGRFISPSVDSVSTEPTDSGFTGAFMNGDGEQFSNYANRVKIGGVAAGVVQAGIDVNGKLFGGNGNVVVDTTGIDTVSGADIKVKQWRGFNNPGDSSLTGIRAISEDTTNSLLLLGGDFTNIGGSGAKYFAFYAKSFDVFIGNPVDFNEKILTICQDGTTAYLGGAFTNANATATADYITSFSGTTRHFTSIGGQLNSWVRAIVKIGNYLYVAGDFTNADGIASADYIARYDTVGGTWASITPTTQFASKVYYLATDGTDLYAVCDNTNLIGTGGDYIVKYSPGSGTWSALANTSLATCPRGVYIYNGILYAVSGDTNMAGTGCDYVAQYNIATSTWSGFGGGFSHSPFALGRSNHGIFVNSSYAVFAGHAFSACDPNSQNLTGVNGVVIYSFSRNKWDDTPYFSDNPNSMDAAYIASNNDVYVGGAFGSIYAGSNNNQMSSIIYAAQLAVRREYLDGALVDMANDINRSIVNNTGVQGAANDKYISASVSSNDLIVSFSSISGTYLSKARIGNTVYNLNGPPYDVGFGIYSLFKPLSVTLAHGTNWFNAGGSELATQAVDYFVYVLFNTNDGALNIGFGRRPDFRTYADASGTNTNENYLAYSGTNAPASADQLELIGRFTATLSAGAGYNWSAATNVISRPIYETDWHDWTPAPTGSGSMTTTSLSVTYARYKIELQTLRWNIEATVTTGGTASSAIRMTIPFTSAWTDARGGAQVSDGNVLAGTWALGTTTRLDFRKYDSSNWALAANRLVSAQGVLQI